MFAARKRPARIAEQMIGNLLGKLSNRRRGFTASGGWSGATWDGDITVSQLGGGYHRNNTMREYTLRKGRAVSIRRSPP
jgi:hypothetical protein